ncbi:MAG: tRNA lysidine(34) synthetase TilS [Synergistaceae bacterium]|jgi:tRNA(Ile)-lysidine synthase|nr:tRNA lysidine(34) synthetase TilS [Synergistaceae bacterium]
MSRDIDAKLHKELKSAGIRQGWWDSPGVLVALSGGGDSMALLELLRKFYRGRVAAAHLEHGFRGASSLADADFVRDYCRDAGVTCFVRHGDVMSQIRRGESAEMAGRRVRYEFFFELMKSENLPVVATGHTADDTVETVLLNLFRGTGLLGLSGIRESRDGIARPIINCFRDDLRIFLLGSGIPWREDETNSENSYQRNKIRNQLLPWLRSNLNSSVERAILGLAGECREADFEETREAGMDIELVSRKHETALAAWDSRAASELPGVRLQSLIREQGRRLNLPAMDRKRVRELRKLIRRQGRWRFQWAGDVEVCGSGALIGWIQRAALSQPEKVEVEIEEGAPRSIAWGEWRIDLEFRGRGKNDDDKWDKTSDNYIGSVWSALLPVNGKRAEVSISSVREARAGCVPWWDSFGRPFISWRCENFSGSWLPGAFKGMQVESTCVIMARIFAGSDTHGRGGIHFG